jgi:V/A-type H+-transporting ATPase subunit I
MDRIAVVAPTGRMRAVLVAVADAGVVEPEVADPKGPALASEALDRLQQQGGRRPSGAPVLAQEAPDVAALERAGLSREIAGEVELERVLAAGLVGGPLSAIAGWCPAEATAALAARLGELGGAVVTLPVPEHEMPPTSLRLAGAAHAFQPLVDTYGTVPYADLDPAALAGIAYVVMFGMMFGDVGHGLLLFGAGILLWRVHQGRLSRYRWAAPFVAGAGAASALFGLAYGDAFGPTGLVPTLWLAPLDHPGTLLAVAVVAGAGLIGASYVLGTVNRWREGGPLSALVAVSGIAGAALYFGLALVALGLYGHLTALDLAGGTVAAAGLVLGLLGLVANAPGGVTGVLQAVVELFDTVLRLGTNTVSFARLAAFGLTHAALGSLVWSGTVAMWHRGLAWWLPAALLFVVGNVVAFALEALVAGVQALRLEYYELFSRIFTTDGRPFAPWHVQTIAVKSQ